MSRRQHRVHGDPQRFKVLADFIATHYRNSVQSIADVAGGKGILTRLLTKKKNFACELIDPRRTVLKGIEHRAAQFEPDMADYYDLLVGLHPDGALRQLGEAALIRPAVIIPCCNFWDTQRRGQYELLTAMEDFYREHAIRFERVELGFRGPKNIAIVSEP